MSNEPEFTIQLFGFVSISGSHMKGYLSRMKGHLPQPNLKSPGLNVSIRKRHFAKGAGRWTMSPIMHLNGVRCFAMYAYQEMLKNR